MWERCITIFETGISGNVTDNVTGISGNPQLWQSSGPPQPLFTYGRFYQSLLENIKSWRASPIFVSFECVSSYLDAARRLLEVKDGNYVLVENYLQKKMGSRNSFQR